MAGEMLISSATKAMSELSESLFATATIIILVVEFPYFLEGQQGIDLLGRYVGYAGVGFALSFALIISLARLGHESKIQYFIAGTFVLPVGIAALFPEYFEGINIPLKKASGVCVCVWGFYLIKTFFDHANKQQKEVKE
ncbi:MAG: hypothetical protein ACTH5B_16155 [Marinomonas sp.]|uniref:hypothetical protein n=1 Tax=Marinomonas sp. TaxID=1904862 RepID=UPI003F9D7779